MENWPSQKEAGSAKCRLAPGAFFGPGEVEARPRARRAVVPGSAPPAPSGGRSTTATARRSRAAPASSKLLRSPLGRLPSKVRRVEPVNTNTVVGALAPHQPPSSNHHFSGQNSLLNFGGATKKLHLVP